MMLKPKRLDNQPYEILKDSIKNTPDWNTLKKKTQDEFIVFAVGNTRKDRSRSAFMDGCNYYGRGVTFHDNFLMKRSSLMDRSEISPEPFVFRMEKNDWKVVEANTKTFKQEQMKQIEGDVYGVPLRKLAVIDQYEGNGDGVSRIETWVKLSHPLQKGANVKAFMYTLDTKFFMECYGNLEYLMNCAYVYQNGVEAYYHV